MGDVDKSPLYTVRCNDCGDLFYIHNAITDRFLSYVTINDILCNKYSYIKYTKNDGSPLVIFIIPQYALLKFIYTKDPRQLILYLYKIYHDSKEDAYEDLLGCSVDMNIELFSKEYSFYYDSYSRNSNMEYIDPLISKLEDEGYSIYAFFIARTDSAMIQRDFPSIRISPESLNNKDSLIDNVSITYKKLPFILYLYITVSRYYRRFKKLFTK